MFRSSSVRARTISDRADRGSELSSTPCSQPSTLTPLPRQFRDPQRFTAGCSTQRKKKSKPPSPRLTRHFSIQYCEGPPPAPQKEIFDVKRRSYLGSKTVP